MTKRTPITDEELIRLAGLPVSPEPARTALLWRDDCPWCHACRHFMARAWCGSTIALCSPIWWFRWALGWARYWIRRYRKWLAA